MPRLHLAAVGDNCIDRYLALGRARVGGNAVNVAVHFALAGQASFYFGAVGDDAAGVWTREALTANGVDVGHLQIRPEVTAYTDIDHGPEGDRIFAFEEFGACRAYRPNAGDMAALARMDHVHLGWLEGPPLSDALRGAAATVSRDCAVNRAGGPVDVAFGSVGESLDLALRERDRLLAEGHRLAVVTCGAAGSLASDGIRDWRAGSPAIAPVDTTGAGDTFIARFLAAWKGGAEIGAALDAAGRAAARSCLHLGGFPQEDRVLERVPDRPAEGRAGPGAQA